MLAVVASTPAPVVSDLDLVRATWWLVGATVLLFGGAVIVPMVQHYVDERKRRQSEEREQRAAAELLKFFLAFVEERIQRPHHDDAETTRRSMRAMLDRALDQTFFKSSSTLFSSDFFPAVANALGTLDSIETSKQIVTPVMVERLKIEDEVKSAALTDCQRAELQSRYDQLQIDIDRIDKPR